MRQITIFFWINNRTLQELTFNKNISKFRTLEFSNTLRGNFDSTCYITIHALNQFPKTFRGEGLTLKLNPYTIFEANWRANGNAEASLIPDHSREIRRNSTFEVQHSGTKLKRDGRVGMSLVPTDCNHLLARYTFWNHAGIPDYTPWLITRVYSVRF